MNEAQRRALLSESFSERYRREPTLYARAPGRVDAMGSHTDYNGGFVLTVPIDRDTWVAAAPRDDGLVRLASLNIAGGGEFQVSQPVATPLDGWGIYIQAVADMFCREGLQLTGCDLLVHGTVPLASGLSSSASLEAAVAVVFAGLGGIDWDPVAMALLCQRAENLVVGVNCGILDQYSVIMGDRGSMLLLDCLELSHRYAAIPTGLQLVICNTCAPRELSGSEYGERRSDCETGAQLLGERLDGVSRLRDISLDQFERFEAELPSRVARRCRFVIEENDRVLRMVEALTANDRTAMQRLCAASFRGARDLFEIAVPAMEAMYESATSAPGSVAVRQAGAGFGGCMLALVEGDRVSAFIDQVGDVYERLSGLTPELYPVHSAPGAGLVDV